MDDCFDRFIELYDKGDINAIVKLMLPDANASYEQLYSQSKLFPAIVNYIDAAVFASFSDAISCNRILCVHLEREPAKLYGKTLVRLKFEQQLLHSALKGTRDLTLPSPFNQLFESERSGILLTPEEINALTKQVPLQYRSLFESQCRLGQGWTAFKNSKPGYASICSHGISFFSRPFYPLQDNMEAFSASFQQNPKLFVFETCSDLIHVLQSPTALAALSQPHHLLLILDLYPNLQLIAQETQWLHAQDLQPVFISKKKQIAAAMPALMQALTACLSQSNDELKADTEVGNWLYHTAKRVLLSIQEERLGIKRSPALFERLESDMWYNPHKGLPAKDRELGPAPKDYFGKKLAQLAQGRRHREKKIRLVHVTAQVVGGKHAPSRLLEALITHHDPEHFELLVISTERSLFHPLEYPHPLYGSDPSNIRGKERLDRFQKHKVRIHILDQCGSYEQAAYTVTDLLQQVLADIVVFHGPDAINYMAAQLTDVPIRILFEHGTPPAYPGFDLMIASSLAAPDIYGESCAKLQTRIEALPFRLDVRTDWLPEPMPREQLGLPNDSLVMTTISNHLQSRLSHDMCLAIAEILKRIPKAYYAPMGRISDDDKEKFLSFFRQHHVEDRVIFLGNIPIPSQYARSMHLYLNEFPFGSGVGILEAMAAGCPAVSMYDLQGPPQARFGGEYMGVDRTVASGKREDYVELACRLLSNPEMYREWSEHAKAQYERRADEKAYVKAFEAILTNCHQSGFPMLSI